MKKRSRFLQVPIEPFTIEPKLPIEVTANDKIDIPVSIANNTSDPRQVNVRLIASNLKPDGKTEEQLTINPDSRVRRLFRRKHEVQRVYDCAYLHRRVIGDDPLRTVRREQRDLVARANTA